MNVVSIVGWIGAGLLLLAYFLLIHKDLTSRSRLYQWMNILGALFLATNNFFINAYPSFVTNALWFLVGLYGMFHAVKHFKKMKNVGDKISRK